MLKVGISGKIASGKSEVENILQKLNYKVFDLDILVHKLFDENEDIKVKIKNEFNTLDRKQIASIIFSDKNKKKILENILYPKLKEIISDIFNKNKNEEMIFISGALLFKSGFYKLFDKTIFINANDEIRLKRLMKRNNLDKDEAKKRLNLQDDGSLADFVIENNDDIEKLSKNISDIIKTLKKGLIL